VAFLSFVAGVGIVGLVLFLGVSLLIWLFPPSKAETRHKKL
jgi:hypothetical protein